MKLSINQHVKVHLNSESFWVLVTEVNSGRIFGTVDNNLVNNNLKLNERVEVISKSDDLGTFYTVKAVK